jgi:hypothetical protein
MIYMDEPFLRVRWDETLSCVVMEWKRFVEGEDFRRGLNTGLKLVQEKHATRWLADLRQIGVIAPEDQEWSNVDWFPRAVVAGLTRMAIVIPENIIAKWSVDRIMNRVHNTNLTVHHFDNVEQARVWLGTAA